MRRLSCLGLAFVGLVTVAPAQERPDIFGTWRSMTTMNRSVTIVQSAEAITISEAGGRLRRCRLDGVPVDDTYSYSTPPRTWNVTSKCRWMSSALVLEEAHRNPATGQAWEGMHTYSLDLKTQNLVVTTVNAATVSPYMATALESFRRAAP